MERNVTPDFRVYIDSFPEGNDLKIGHLTQLVLGRLTRVGCAAAREFGYHANQKPETDLYQSMHLTCMYFTSKKDWGGNLFDKAVYTRGPPLSKCPKGTKANSVYPNLCGEIDHQDEIDSMNPWRKKELSILNKEDTARGKSTSLFPNYYTSYFLLVLLKTLYS